MNSNHPLARLRHHVTGAIERGEAEAVVERLDDDVEDVIDDVLERGRVYGFRTDADTVREAVEMSAELLSIELTEPQIVLACDRVLEQQ